MTIIHTVEDLIRALDENPEWVEALRARLLTKELLEMPNTLARFIESTNRQFEQINKRLDEHDRRFDRVDQRFDEHDKRLDEHDDKFDKTESLLRSIINDLSILKGAHARNVAMAQYDLIAEDMGLTAISMLSAEEIRNIARALRVSGDISRPDYESFRIADIIIEAEDSEGNPCYIAVEASFTVNGRDTRRAVRNAGFLARLKDVPAWAAVSGIDLDERIRPMVDSGEVYWHQLSRHMLGAD